VRGKGNTGVAKAARGFLANLKLDTFSVANEKDFACRLDEVTDSLASSFPVGAQHWGLARKCINIFLRDAFYNRFLSRPIEHCEEWFEIPLDRVIADALQERYRQLPKWQGVKGVTATLSSQYQASAKNMANSKGVARVYLDSELWVSGRPS
jgi:hypothetical protein